VTVSAAVTRPGQVTVRTIDGHYTLIALISTSNPETTDGRGGWSEVARQRRPSVVEWLGTSTLKATLPLMLDAWAGGGTVASSLGVINAMAPISPTKEPIAVTVTGAWPIPSNIHWQIQSVTWGERVLRPDGQVARAEATLELVQDTRADVVIRTSPAKASKTKNGKTKKQATYTVKRGDTLSSIAAKKLGSASKWKTIATLNKIRDPNHLRVGQVLKLP
jgi:nucleoid-associated protein YgaU